MYFYREAAKQVLMFEGTYVEPEILEWILYIGEPDSNVLIRSRNFQGQELLRGFAVK